MYSVSYEGQDPESILREIHTRHAAMSPRDADQLKQLLGWGVPQSPMTRGDASCVRRMGTLDAVLMLIITLLLGMIVVWCGIRMFQPGSCATGATQAYAMRETDDAEEDDVDWEGIKDIHAPKAIVMFYATWCEHCKQYKDEFRRLAREVHRKYGKDKVVVGKIEQKHISEDMLKKFGVTGFPHLSVLKRNITYAHDAEATPDMFDSTEIRRGPATELLERYDDLFGADEDSAPAA